MDNQVCLLLGSNIAPEVHLPRAVALLAECFPVQRVSQAWETPAVGSDGPNFINAAVLVKTSLDPLTIKEQILRPLESRLGRVRTSDKNAPRTIDIDVMVWDGQPLATDIAQYAHIAVPMADLLPHAALGAGGEPLYRTAERLLQRDQIRSRPELNLSARPGSSG